MRRRVYEALTNPRPSDLVGRLVSFAILLLIAANVAASVAQTDDEIARSAPRFFKWFEIVSVIVFTAEYILRLWSCTADPVFASPVRGRLRQALRPMAMIDLAAIAPFYFDLFLAGFVDLRFMRALRLLRLFRLLRVGPLGSAFSTLIRIVQDKRAALGVTLAIVFIAVLVSAGAMYLVERDEPGTQFTSIPKAMWWGIVTITTIGYGDMVPSSPLGQLVAGFVSFIGICALALPVGIVSSGFVEELNRTRRRRSDACPHCGGTLAQLHEADGG